MRIHRVPDFQAPDVGAENARPPQFATVGVIDLAYIFRRVNNEQFSWVGQVRTFWGTLNGSWQTVAGHVLVYLHEAYDLSVESCSRLVQ